MTLRLPDALEEACMKAYHPELCVDTDGHIVISFLWEWGSHPSDPLPRYKVFWRQTQDGHSRFAVDVFSCLQRALLEGEEADRVFALFLLGGLATLEARNVLRTYLDSPHPKERWASTIALGRLQEARVFPLLPGLLLEGFWPSDLFPRLEDLQEAQKLYHKRRKITDAKHDLWNLLVPPLGLDFEEEEKYQKELEEYRRWEEAIVEQERATDFSALGRFQEQLFAIDYEWYLRQRAECALALGKWGDVDAVPALREALQAAWFMEREWPDYAGLDLFGPEIWYFFQDRLLFALGQLGDTSVWSSLRLPDDHLLVARIYWILGRLQVQNDLIFWQRLNARLFDTSPRYQELRVEQAKLGNIYPFVEPERVKQLLADHFDVSPTAQEEYLARFPAAFHERKKERLSVDSREE